MNTQHSTSKAPLISIVAVFAALVLSACSSENQSFIVRPTITPDVVSAQATAIYGAGLAQVAVAQATYVAEQGNIRATAETQATESAINATLTAHDVSYAPTRAAVQATIDAARAAEAQARLDAAKLTVVLAVTAQAQNIKMSDIDVMSKTNAYTTTVRLNQAAVDRSNDWMFTLADLVGHWLPIAAAIVMLFCLWWVVRAVAARIAGDKDRAMLVLGYAMHPALLPAPSYSDEDDRETPEHGNTENTENTVQNTGNTADLVFPYNHHGQTSYLPRMTLEERDQLRGARIKTERILLAAQNWNMAHNSDKDYDPARIARYDALGVKAEDRGEVCDMLEALNPAAVSIKKGGKDQGTYVTPEYGADVAQLMRLVVSGDVRVYPIGFRSEAIEAAETLNAAVHALDRA